VVEEVHQKLLRTCSSPAALSETDLAEDRPKLEAGENADAVESRREAMRKLDIFVINYEIAERQFSATLTHFSSRENALRQL
jgi:hypothetical protein